jgi:class 3 adenylate cyclase/tetratricopeptide (TPR) repeat protein
MTTNQSSRSAERRVVTLLFCDVVGSTTLAESMDPEDWSEIVNEAVTAMARCVERYGGTVAQFAGDSILALFGAPAAHEDDPYRAIRAGVEIVESVREGSSGPDGAGLSVRVGINTGLVVVGDIEAGALNVYSALGDAANVAARLQSLAEANAVLISEATYRVAANDVEAREVGPFDLKGKSEPVAVYEVVGVRAVDERRRGIPGLTSPMVGRDAELATLEELLAAAAAGTGRVAAVIGEPGVGKSRLTVELGSSVAELDGAIWAMGRCVPYDDELPYHLIASLVRSLAGVTTTDAPDVVEKAVADVAAVAGVAEASEPLLHLIGLRDEASEELPADLDTWYAEAVYGLVSSLAVDRRPVILVCEDVHWADPSSVGLMSGLLERAPATPVLLLLVMRPERETNGWELLAAARRVLAESLTELHLRPLPEEDSRALVANLLEIESLPDDLRQKVLDKAEGNPFFLEEVVRMLVERDLVTEVGGRWIAQPGIGSIDVPETLHGLLASRIDLLPAAVRRAGRVAAVIGRDFPAGLLQAVHPLPAGSEPVTLHPDLAELESHGMVRLIATVPELRFSFRHALIHDVMYAGLLKRERRRLHAEVATAIERSAPDRLAELSPALSRHHAEAGNTARAIEYAMTAGRTAMARGARSEAHRFYVHALEMLDEVDDPDARTIVRAALGRARAGLTFTPAPEAIAGLEGVLDVARELDDADLLTDLYVPLIRIDSMQGSGFSNEAYRSRLEAGHALVPRLTDEATKGLLDGMLGQGMRSADEYVAAIGLLTGAVDRLEASGRLVEASFNASFLADSYATIGDFGNAAVAIDRAHDLGVRSGDPNAVLDADLIRGRISAEKGELDDAVEHTRRGIDGAVEVGNTFCTLAGNFMVADQKLRLGDVEGAIGHLETSTGLAEYCNAGGFEALGQAWLASARARLGNLDPSQFDEPLQMAIAGGSRSGEALVRFQRAVAVAGEGRLEESFEDFERALALFESYGGRPNMARAHHAYGQALEAAGHLDDAREHFRAADRIFEELGITPDPVLSG